MIGTRKHFGRNSPPYLVGGAGVCDDLQQGHLVNGREVVHPDDILWPFGGFGDVSNRQRGCVGRDDTGFLQIGLQITNL